MEIKTLMLVGIEKAMPSSAKTTYVKCTFIVIVEKGQPNAISFEFAISGERERFYSIGSLYTIVDT